MPDRIVVAVSSVLLLSLLVSCAPQPATLTQSEPTHSPTSTPFVTPTQLEPADPPTPSVTPTQPEPIAISTSLPQVGELNSCPEWVPEQQPGQVGYEGVFPGITTDDEIIQRFGEPPEGRGSSWNYRELAPTFVIEGGVVTRMHVYFSEVDDDFEKGETLTQILDQYGCPDLIYAYDLSPHPSGQYISTSLVYLRYGVELFLGEFPLTASDRLEIAYYFPPSSLEEFLSQNPSLEDPNQAARVQWEEAIELPTN